MTVIQFTPRGMEYERHKIHKWAWWLRAGFDPALQKLLDAIPGVRYDRGEGRWFIPTDTRPIIDAWAKQNGWVIRGPEPGPLKLVVPPKTDRQLHPHQQAAVDKTRAGGGNLICFETGTGKTAAAISYLKSQGTAGLPALIVAPKITLRHWQHELQKWGLTEPVRLFKKGAELQDAANLFVRVALVPYSLLDKVPDTWVQFRTIIFDEAHYIKERRSKQGKKASAICNWNPIANVVALTATPIANEPKDLWAILDVIWQGRFGTFWQFCYRYCNILENKYGKSPAGLNDRHKDEFNARLAAVSSSTKRSEVGHLLPKCNVSLVRSDWDTHKATATRAWLQPRVAVGKRCAILTYGIEAAEQLAADLPDAIVVTGKESVDRRLDRIDKVRVDPAKVLVASMKSIGVGIELTEFTEVLFAETYWSPAVLIQALGRFNRLSSNPDIETNLQILYTAGTKDEVVALVVKQKIENILDVTNSSGIDSQLAEALNDSEGSEERFKEDIRRAIIGRAGLDI